MISHVSKPRANTYSLLIRHAVKVVAFVSLTLTACSHDKSAPQTGDTHQSDTSPQVLRIAAAANLSEVLPKVVAGYKAAHSDSHQDIELSFASSGKLYAQIEAGAPYDVFLSANQSYPDKLAASLASRHEDRASQEGTAQASANPPHSYAPFTYAQGQLALYSVTHPITVRSVDIADLLSQPPDSKIAIANPALAPYGAAAAAYLKSQQIHTALTAQNRLIQSENIGQAFQYAHTGNVDYGFVAQSQVNAINAPAAQFVTLAPDSYPAILQDALQLTDTQMATDFVAYLRTPAAQAYFIQAGYLAAPF